MNWTGISMTPSAVVVAASLAVLCFYVLVGLKNYTRNHSHVSYFLNGRSLGTGQVRNTFSGAAISLSTVLVFFLTLGLSFGWQIFLSPLTLIVGIVIFDRAVYGRLAANRNLWEPGHDGAPSFASLTDVVHRQYGSPAFAWIVTAISGLGILAVLIAEMMVGVTLLSLGPITPTMALFAISVTVFLYATLGGLRSVVETDKWQLGLVLTSVLFVLGFLLLSGDQQSNAGPFVILFRGWTPQFAMPASLWLNISVVNICLLPASLRVWQVAAATKSRTSFRSGLYQSGWVIVVVSISALLISKAVLALSGQPVTSVEALFDYLRAGNALSAYVIYPLFVVALMSALISTADSAILPLAQSIHSAVSTTFNPRLNSGIVACLILFAMASFYAVTALLGLTLVNWILTVFSITTVIAPVIAVPLFLSSRVLTRAGVVLASTGVVAGCALALVWSITYAGNLAIQPWNCVIGVGISSITILVSMWFFSSPEGLES